ncbi:MAG: hypothetical protein NTX65_12645 [Ignavibacteriales bacterium]|nr:hypothetical protein [Ignavibacteriales bacterium]
MKRIKIYISILLISLIANTNLFGQISGISGSKLLVPRASTISLVHFEFEPSFSVFSSHECYNINGSTDNLSNRHVVSSLSFRITMGVLENLEFGTSFSTGLQDIFIGTKFTAVTNEYTNVALIVGGSLPAGNFSDTALSSDYTAKYSYSAGFIVSQKINDKFSVDGIFTYSKINGSSDFNHLLNYGLSFGLFISQNFQAVAELNGFTTYDRIFHSNKISVTPGFTYQFSQNLLIVFGMQNDILGRNELSGTNYVTAFTMSF